MNNAKERGQGLCEYSLIVCNLIAFIVALLTALGFSPDQIAAFLCHWINLGC